MITNPEYEYSDAPGNYTFGAIGFEIWQVTAGTVFDSLLLTTDINELYIHGNETMESIKREKETISNSVEESEFDEVEEEEEVEKDEL